MKIPEISKKIIRETLSKYFEEISFVEILNIEIEPQNDPLVPDAVASLMISGQPWKLIIEAKPNGEIRYVKQAILALKSFLPENEKSCGIFMAPFISEDGAKLLKNHNIGYMDFAGNTHLEFAGVYIDKSGNSNPFKRKSRIRSLYSRKATRILRVLLNSPDRFWKINELAEEAGVSPGHVTNTKKLLEDKEWISHGKKGVHIIKPEELIRDWEKHYSYQNNTVHRFYSREALHDIERKIAGAENSSDINKTALTGFSAAARLRQAVRYNRAAIYVQSISDSQLERWNLKKVTSGANVFLLEPYDTGVFYGSRNIDGCEIVSPVQIYLDLMGQSGRGEEAAQEIYEHELRSSW